MTDLERIIAEMREASCDFTKWGQEILEGFADRLAAIAVSNSGAAIDTSARSVDAALAGAAPVAWVNPLELECLQEFGGMIVATGDEESESERTCPLFTHAPAKAREDGGSDEDAYVIERMGKLLAEIAVIVNGPEPPLTRWSYHDLPEKVRSAIGGGAP